TLLARRVHVAREAEERLHVMPDLVRDHIRLREVATAPQSRTHLVEEAQVQVDLAVERAIEGTGCGGSPAALAPPRAAEEDEARRLVRAALALEDSGPGVFGVTEDRAHEIRTFVIRGRRLGLAGIGREIALKLGHDAEHLHGIDPRKYDATTASKMPP